MDNLSSASKRNYTKLKELLEGRKWKEANNETARVMLEVVDKKKIIKHDELEKFPCEDLHTINQLWFEHSSGRFGFSVQLLIWQSLQQRIQKQQVFLPFCDSVKWRLNDNWLEQWLCEDSTEPLALLVPDGYLPRLFWDFPAFNNVSPHCIEALLSRVKACGL